MRRPTVFNIAFVFGSVAVLGALGALSACQHSERAAPSSTEALPKSAPARSVLSTRSYAKPPQAEIKQRLSPLSYDVTQHEATELPFQNEFWNNHAAGSYECVCCGTELFDSDTKFDSGTGWPSFTQPVENARIVSHTDSTFGMSRTEVRSKGGDSHLGHVFEDGPAPTGLRYCINSASLRFIPAKELQNAGYAEYLPLFAGS